jgi:hypothetical protein
VIDRNGPLPLEATYTSKGGTFIISASGSGYRNTTVHGWIGMGVLVDGVKRDGAVVYTNEKNSHKAFVGDHVTVSGLPAGQHTIRFEAVRERFACGGPDEGSDQFYTTTDGNAWFKVSVLEIPA